MASLPITHHVRVGNAVRAVLADGQVVLLCPLDGCDVG
jgi:hypothetical protein